MLRTRVLDIWGAWFHMIRLLGSLKSGVKPPHSKERLKSLECAGLAALWSAATLSLTAEYSSPNWSSYPRAQQFIAGEGGERFAIRRTFFIKLSYLLRRSLELSGAASPGVQNL